MGGEARRRWGSGGGKGWGWMSWGGNVVGVWVVVVGSESGGRGSVVGVVEGEGGKMGVEREEME